ncbi:DUF4249 domain-containing protein [Marinoscillum furvescens]|uniref:Uncharacterized protein DUF4249 n=1 Tax=Marinoscillum furvescens DSM 4134 TaxID=1122208 RepID=A0A3D9L2B7_MARFU|nr:DUF4249 domain-containing protein [Marinoscillum furvescens]RED96585.1 uncharacterized protein DUF4249 [Marinoscillum furvescens DSM 4134]
MNWNFKTILIPLLVLIAACNGLDEADFNERKVVIDGFIEQGQYPVVYLTYSSGFYEPVDSASLQELVLATARVEVSDGENSEVLTLFRNNEVYPPFFYRGTDLTGEPGKTYHLEVRSEAGVYTATTTIPKPVDLDSVWIEVDQEVDTLGQLWVQFNDAGLQDDYYRFFTSTNGAAYVPAFKSTLLDRTFDGETYSHPVLRQPRSALELGDEVLFQKGDTIGVKLCHIDEAHYRFWNTLEQELYLVGNPFGSVGNEVASNIRGNKPALGIWGGYGVSYGNVVFQ